MPDREAHPDRALDDLLRVGAAWEAVTRVLERSLHGAAISLEQALAVLMIRAGPQPLLLRGLAARLVQQPQSTTILMDRLERAGWAKRIHDLEDRRAIRVAITEAGEAKAADIGPLLLAAAEQVLASLDAAEHAGWAGSLVVLYEACWSQTGVGLPQWAGWE